MAPIAGRRRARSSARRAATSRWPRPRRPGSSIARILPRGPRPPGCSSSPRRPYELAWCRYRQAEASLAVKAPRADAAAALAEAWSLATEIGAGRLAGSISGLARIARLDLPEAGSPASATTDEPAAADGPADPFGLTAREREVLALLAEGQTNRRIADSLFISESTASVHVSNILGKLGVSNRVEAAAAAVRLGLDH